ncbi:cytochrome d ubiquinol oxidase subunit II [Paucilactobacillus sp. N302-9]
MSLTQNFWFLVIGLLFSIFFFLEGFDFGVGMSIKGLAKDESERDMLISSIGPHWDGNEVWLITAGGAMFASYPMWYASLFSGFYLMLFFVLIALIFRGVAFEFRSRMHTDQGRNIWEWAATIGSFCAPFLLGMIFTAMVKGMPMDKAGDITAGFTDYVNLFSIVGGVAVALLCLLHGLNFIRLKTTGDLRSRALAYAKPLYWVLYAGEVVFAVLVYFYTDFFTTKPVSTFIILAAIVVLSVIAHAGTILDHEKLSFFSTGLTLAGVVVLLFNGLYPRVMIANNPKFSILAADASSTPYTLHIMTIVTLSILPIVLVYFIWSYWVFRQRLQTKES